MKIYSTFIFGVDTYAEKKKILQVYCFSDVFELQGGVDVYEVRLQSDIFSNVYTYDADVNMVVIGDLTPSTTYEVRVTIVVHGGETISSDSHYVTTLDGGKTARK